MRCLACWWMLCCCISVYGGVRYAKCVCCVHVVLYNVTCVHYVLCFYLLHYVRLFPSCYKLDTISYMLQVTYPFRPLPKQNTHSLCLCSPFSNILSRPEPLQWWQNNCEEEITEILMTHANSDNKICVKCDEIIFMNLIKTIKCQE